MLEEGMKQSFVVDRFSPSAALLREAFESRFRDPKAAQSDRFVWDFWHVPDQYTLVRTPADHFFPAKPYQAFLRDLGHWARENLGCTAITPPWLSYYIEGCEQKFHADVPHGPWAFVFSLSPKKRLFQGGETMLLRPEILSYWNNFAQASSRELEGVIERIEPSFNRLVVFDPRVPHGVSRVSGTMDPREARLVLHGWFTDPRPCLDGALSARQAAGPLDEAVEAITREMSELGLFHGVLSLRLEVRASGEVAACRVLADTLVSLSGLPESEVAKIRRFVQRRLALARFPRRTASTKITLPLLFR